MIAAPNPEGNATAAQNVGCCVILGEPQWVPHRGDVKVATELESLGAVREMECHIRDTFVAFALEMVLSHPERVVAEPIHQLRHRLSLVKDGAEMLVRKAAVIYRNTAIANIVHIDMASKRAVEFCYHFSIPTE